MYRPVLGFILGEDIYSTRFHTPLLAVNDEMPSCKMDHVSGLTKSTN